MIISIQSWWVALSQGEQLFYGMAIVSSIFFLFQMMATFLGADTDVEAELDLDGIDTGFALVSIKSLTAFFMFAGWGGVAALSEEFSFTKALMIAFLFGFVAMVAVAYLLSLILKLQESGTVKISGAISKTGDVYVPIPGSEAGLGRIQLSLKGKVMEFNAMTTEKELETGTKVVVVKVLKDNVMLVKPVSK